MTVGAYLQGLLDEALTRGYNFDGNKILFPELESRAGTVPVNTGQLVFEAEHLLRKLQQRDPERGMHLQSLGLGALPAHPLFIEIPGPVADWEKDQATRH